MRVKKIPTRDRKHTRKPTVMDYANQSIAEFMADAQRFDKYLNALRIGAHPRTAAAVAGINANRLAGWLKRGTEASTDCAEGVLHELTQQAIGQASLSAEAAVLAHHPATYLKSTTRAVLHTDSSVMPAVPDTVSIEDAQQVAAVPTITADVLAGALIELMKAGVRPGVVSALPSIIDSVASPTAPGP